MCNECIFGKAKALCCWLKCVQVNMAPLRVGGPLPEPPHSLKLSAFPSISTCKGHRIHPRLLFPLFVPVVRTASVGRMKVHKEEKENEAVALHALERKRGLGDSWFPNCHLANTTQQYNNTTQHRGICPNACQPVPMEPCKST